MHTRISSPGTKPWLGMGRFYCPAAACRFLHWACRCCCRCRRCCCRRRLLPIFPQVSVASDVAHVLSLPRRQLDSFLGAAGSGLASRTQVVSALRQSRCLEVRVMVVVVVVLLLLPHMRSPDAATPSRAPLNMSL